MRVLWVNNLPASVLQPREALPGVWFFALCDAARSVPFCPFSRSRPFRPVLPVHPVPSRSAAGCYLPCVAALRTGHCLRHSHASVTSFHLIPSSSLSLGLLHFGRFSGARLFVVFVACSLSLLWLACPFPPVNFIALECCRFRRADLFRQHAFVPVRPAEGRVASLVR